ncbi:MAG TPA: DNA polymerase/3'-5' exonuclease PolX [Polyangiaceae bacterium]|nr:DNA polymerase/3'-5' exonuclease PolX [Polyangiaceae bacterium]
MALEMARLANEALARAGLGEATVVGEARRGVELVRELALLLPGRAPARDVARALERATACEGAWVEGRDVVRMRFGGGGPVRVTLVPPSRWLETVIRETGSTRHVRWLETKARASGGLRRACARARTERDVYDSLGVPYAPPELREGPTRRVPELVDVVRGVFHVHTTWSDGAASIVDMGRAARDAGFAYVGISEHSKAATYARGLDARQLARQSRAVARARKELPDVRLLHGVEVDVLRDGSLDLDDATLGSLDFVIASVHEDLEMSERQMTRRLVRAVSHPLVTILGHPTGRLLLGRQGVAFDLEAVATAAAANDTFLEINANPQRLDLGADLVRRAAARGARFAIDPDAHTPRGVRDTWLGLSVARRAGLGADQVLNAAGTEEVVAYLSSRRGHARRRLLRS